MSNALEKVLLKIGDEYQAAISAGGRHYLEVEIHKEAERFGVGSEKHKLLQGNAYIPLKEPVEGMKVRIDGRAWVDYAQFDSGVVVPAFIARQTGLPFKSYQAQDSMIKNFSRA